MSLTERQGRVLKQEQASFVLVSVVLVIDPLVVNPLDEPLHLQFRGRFFVSPMNNPASSGGQTTAWQAGVRLHHAGVSGMVLTERFSCRD
jgi:hypothetical protein